MEENKPIYNKEIEQNEIPNSSGKVMPADNPQDAVHEQQLNTPSTGETIVTVAETSDLPTGQAGIINPPSYIKNMEVHHHAHDPAAPHHKKNWKSYFWEFLMLFLAVFCGFLAEYQLEHKIEAERAKKYMYDMVENLKYDTIRYNRNLRNNEILGKQLDSFRAEISMAVKGQMNSKRLYELWIKTASFSSVVYNRTALTQLKNSGSFRLIKNDRLSSSISDYYERKITASEEQEEQLRRSSERLSITSAQIFYYEAFDQMLSTETTFREMNPDLMAKRIENVLNGDYPLTLLNSNPADLKLLYNNVAMKENSLKQYNAYLRWARETAIALMQEIDTEYHFKN